MKNIPWLPILFLGVACGPPKTTKLPEIEYEQEAPRQNASAASASPAATTTATAPPAASQNAASASEASMNMDELVRANSAFAIDLLHAIRQRRAKENLFVSPYSIFGALAIPYAGSGGDTATEMAKVFHVPPTGTVGPSFKQLTQELQSRGQGAKGKDGQPFRFRVANGIFLQKGLELLPDFSAKSSADFGATLDFVDFKAPKPNAPINRWVAEKTENKIQNLIPDGILNADSRAVIANAVYFNAAWATKFNKAATRPGPFTRLDGTKKQVPLMMHSGSYRYSELPNAQVVELPYDGNETAMTIFLPTQGGTLTAFEQALTADSLKSMLEGVGRSQVELALPKFKIETGVQLRPMLTDMGMRKAFTGEADFSKMIRGEKLAIAEVIHKARVEVDENGTEAAAATAVVMERTMAALQPKKMVVDRPFLFVIRDTKTGEVLFLGSVTEP